ncbi:hypothetical protein D3C84_1025890 [compost metagenome]
MSGQSGRRLARHLTQTLCAVVERAMHFQFHGTEADAETLGQLLVLLAFDTGREE